MSTWSGWAKDFLAAAGLPDTANNRKFLNDWAANANHPNCGDNPIDLSWKLTGSTNCAGTNEVGVHIQAYSTHTWARTAFNSQIHSGAYPHLLAALKSGNPYTVNDPGAVSLDLAKWNSTKFDNVYLNEAGSGTVQNVNAPKAHHGWRDLRRSVNQRWPAAMHESDKLVRVALRSLSHARKVRL